MSNLRLSLRFLRTSPGFATAAILTLAVGIAVNTTCLTLLNNLAFRLIPAVEADRLVRVYPVDAAGRRNNTVSHPDYRELRDQGSELSGLAAYVPLTVTLRSGSGSGDLAEPREVLAYAISANYFTILGSRPALGRTMFPEEDAIADAHPVAVISHRMWQRLGASDDVLKTELIVNGRAFSIIGVMPADFVGTEPLAADLWVPTGMQARVNPGKDLLHLADEPWLLLLGRLRPGATPTSAEQQLSAVLREVTHDRPAETRPSGLMLRRAAFFPVDDDPAEVAAVMLIATLLLLAAASANVANLMLARGLTRQREMAVRLALGASLPKLVWQLFAEGAWVALLSGVLALLLSSWTLSTLYALALPRLPFEVLFDLSPDWRVFAATSVLCGFVAVLVGLGPALQARSIEVVEALHGSVSLFGARVRQSRARAVLVNAQVAISVALIIAAGLLARAAVRGDALDLGFSPRGVFTTVYDLKRHQYSPARSAAFTRTMVERARSIPGVVSATMGSHVALTGGLRVTKVWSPDSGHQPRVQTSRYVLVGDGYFATLGIRVVRGRDVNIADGQQRVPEAVVSEVLAGRLWPDGDPLGQRIRTALSGREYTVVGVVRDTRAGSLWRDKEQAVYLAPTSDEEFDRMRPIVHAEGSLDGPTREMRRLALELEPDLVFNATDLEDAIALWLLPSRAAAGLSATIGLLALLIASFGAYGVMSHVLARQTREFAIRHALGADVGRLVRHGLRQSLVLVLPGLGSGLIAGGLVGRMISAFLFGLSAADPLAYVTGAAVVLSTCLAACYLPVRRIAHGDPSEALRVE